MTVTISRRGLSSASSIHLFPPHTWRGTVSCKAALLLLLYGGFSFTDESHAAQRTGSREPALRSIRVVPESATLQGRQASQQFVVMGEYSDGLERDVTLSSRFRMRDSSVATVDEVGKVKGNADGETQLQAEYGGLDAVAQVYVKDSLLGPLPSFERNIAPILTRHGCNGSNCHGGVKGRGGFKLSLYSLNPYQDYKAIVEGGVFHVLNADPDDPTIPRIDMAEPERSLLLWKPTMQVPHGGGARFERDSAEYSAILDWIEKGAAYRTGGHVARARIEQLEVFPEEIVLGKDGSQHILVSARSSSGRAWDISDEVRYESQNPAVVEVDRDGLVTAVQTGETNVLIRAAGRTVYVRIGVISDPVFESPEIPKRNFIDERVFSKLQRFHIAPSELSDDSEFLRRVCLDIMGTLPPPNRVREFLADADPGKRDKLIDVLLDSPEYVDFWTFRFSDLFRVDQEPNYSQLYWEWIRSSIATNKPYDQMARERLAAQGRDRPSRHYYENNSQPERILAEELRLFAGRRFDCAQCHDHPFEPWSQDQFWGLAAFFGNLDFVGYYDLVFDNPAGGYGDKGRTGPLLHPRKQTVVQPTFLDGTRLSEHQQRDPRVEFANWLTAHPYFAEAIVNRIWGYFFGRGIVDPVDDFKASNPPTHPSLLASLAAEFRESGHDLKRLIRLIVRSRTYQLTSKSNASNRNDRLNYSHFVPRPLEAEVLLDAISQVTGAPEVFHEKPESDGGQPPLGTRAIQLKSPVRYSSQFLDLYGRPMRHVLPERDPSPSISQALHFYGGDTYTAKLALEGGRLDQLLRREDSDGPIIEEFYLAALSRFPTAKERTELEAALVRANKSQRRQAFADLTWALLTSREFAYNH